MTLSREELLVLLIEECAEVIQAATKCLRFGYTRNEPEYGRNDEVLSQEIGDVLGVVDRLSIMGPLDQQYLETARGQKIAKAERAKRVRM